MKCIKQYEETCVLMVVLCTQVVEVNPIFYMLIFEFTLILSVIYLFLCTCRYFGLSEEEFGKLQASIKRGDIVGIQGFPGTLIF